MMYVWYAEPPQVAVVQNLIKNISILQVDDTGWSALHYAASNPWTSIEIYSLLSGAAHLNCKEGQSALMMYFKYSNFSIN